MIVIADDITGAAEIAGIALRYGLEVHFALDVLPLEIAMKSSDETIIIIATDSRSFALADAVAIHRTIALETLKAGHHRLFKKCDSVLRGHVLAELEVLREITNHTTVFLQPANPAAGRCIQQGRYQIHKVPLHKTAFATDPDFPAVTDLVQELLWRGNSYPSDLISVDDCPDIHTLAKLAKQINREALWAGSSAFFEQLLIHHNGKTALPAVAPRPVKSPLLVLVGSQHSSFEEWMLHHQPKTSVLEIPLRLIAEDVTSVQVEKFRVLVRENLLQHEALIIRLSTNGLPSGVTAQQLLERIGLIMQPILLNFGSGELWMTGGATAYAILKRMEWTELTPAEELLPGVVRMRVTGTSNIFITVKPGSYPWPEGMLL